MQMKTIHKHAIPVDEGTVELELPIGSIVRDVAYLVTERNVFMWVEVPADLSVDKEIRSFKAFKTGDGVPGANTYIGTTIDQYTPEAYHVFEVPAKK